jgi:hypothetical protein
MNRPTLRSISTICLLLVSLPLVGCSKQEAPKNSSAPPSPQTNVSVANSNSKNTTANSANRFHLTGVLLNKDRSPALDKTVLLQEITGSEGDRKATITFGVVDGEMGLTSPHAKTEASGRFDIDIDPAKTDVAKEFGLTILDLSSPKKGPATTPPFLTVHGKRVTFKLEGPPREISLGEIVTK